MPANTDVYVRLMGAFSSMKKTFAELFCADRQLQPAEYQKAILRQT
jgi:hypothetical protein